ncbi:ASCH domain-containing protein [Achromobacter aegrifaciens]
MSDLFLALKGEYFDAIKARTKTEEYRLVTPYWRKRLVGRSYDHVVLTRGYPKRDDHERRLVLPWRGFDIKIIRHPHFGSDPVKVYAISIHADPPPLSAQPE